MQREWYKKLLMKDIEVVNSTAKGKQVNINKNEYISISNKIILIRQNCVC